MDKIEDEKLTEAELIDKIADSLDMEELLKQAKEPFNIKIPYIYRFRVGGGRLPKSAAKEQPDKRECGQWRAVHEDNTASDSD
jgi:hypothetical protein